MKNIAVIVGGDSSEWKVSLASGKNVAAALDRTLFDVYLVFLRGSSWKLIDESVLDEMLEGGNDSLSVSSSETEGSKNSSRNTRSKIVNPPGVELDKSNFSAGGVKFDYALIMIHGEPGETGQLQGYLEMMGVPFNTSSSYVCAVSFDKQSCKRFLDFAGVNLARDLYLRREHTYDVKEIVSELGLPLFVKPTIGGSSFGISKVDKEEELVPAINKAFDECPALLVEECISGRELTVGVYKKDGNVCTLPVTEITTTRGWFDYQAKYHGLSNEICPAPVNQKITTAVKELSKRIYIYMGCNGLVRMDYILRGDSLYFLEINSTPGMTPMSLVPKQIEAAGLTLKEFLTTLISQSLQL